ncbi:M64 family metallopeptidase [Thermaurantiacus sp.]
MGSIRMVVPRPEVLPAEWAREAAPVSPAASGTSASSEGVVTFFDARGDKRGRRRRVAIQPLVLEAPGDAGDMARVAANPLVEFQTRLPIGATSFRLEEAGRLPIEAGIAETASPRPRKPRSITRLGGRSPRFLLAVLAERYDQESAFLADCRELFAAILATPPFGDFPDRIGLVALYWKTDPLVGQLGPLQESTATDLIYGDRRLAAAFLAKARVKANRAIVLVNHPRRGGAGGTADVPAWVTNRHSATDRWTDVALHELGHALGLGDEYDSDNPDEPPGLEPNIATSPDPMQAPWKALVTAPSPVPTARSGEGAHLPEETVGTFEGARYRRTGRFRAQYRCRMRSTRDPFCACCQALIRAKLA